MKLFIPGRQEADSERTVLLFPHAGALAATYLKLKDHLPEKSDLFVFELPEPLRARRDLGDYGWEDLARDLAADLLALWSRPLIVLGHSMGALVALSGLQGLLDESARPTRPLHFVVSAMNAPLTEGAVGAAGFAALDIEPLRDRIYAIGGIPDEMMAHPTALNFFVARVRDDFRFMAKFPFRTSPPCIPWPISAYCPTEDRLSHRPGLLDWQVFTNQSFQFSFVKGGHFYFLSRPDAFKELVVRASACFT